MKNMVLTTVALLVAILSVPAVRALLAHSLTAQRRLARNRSSIGTRSQMRGKTPAATAV